MDLDQPFLPCGLVAVLALIPALTLDLYFRHAGKEGDSKPRCFEFDSRKSGRRVERKMITRKICFAIAYLL